MAVRLFAGAALFVVVGSATLSGAASVAAGNGNGSEALTRFSAEVVLEPDATLHAVETIDYDFAGAQRHGIFRFIPDRFDCDRTPADACPRGFDRLTPVTKVSVRSSTGAPSTVKLSDQSGNRVIRVGDPKRLITGQQTYVVTYDIDGVMNPANATDELSWNVTGNGWTVPIDAIDVRLTTPVAPTSVRCVTGPIGATNPCDEITVDGTTLRARASSLGTGEGMTLIVELPKGVVATSSILDRHWTLSRAFSRSGGALAITGAAALTGVIGVAALGRRGRDRRFAGSDVEVAMGRRGQTETQRGAFEKLPEVMEFAPPNDIRPGQLGALIDEVAHPRDITATIVDLAIRKHLRIEEVADDARPGKVDDHLLTRLPPPTDELAPYESTLLDLLFASGNPVQLSSLRQQWSGSFATVRNALYDDLVGNGWYDRRPDRQRAKAIAIGGVVVLAGIATTIVLAATTTLGLVGVPIIAAGIALLVVGRRAPVRTAAGTAMAARSLGFKRLIETPTQQDMARFAERHDVFIEYLPYAIVFGCATKWAATFASLGVLPPPVGAWYVPIGGVASSPSWDAISQHVSDFASTAGASLNAAAAGSSGGSNGGGNGGGGGFSGGGFGGGGGGSW